MNKQRKVLITITYNEMGIIIDTKAEKVAQPNSQPTCNQLATDCISRQEAIRWVKTECNPYGKPTLDFESGKKVIEHLEQMPSAQPDSDMIHLQKEQAYMQGYEDGQAALREELWERERERREE